MGKDQLALSRKQAVQYFYYMKEILVLNDVLRGDVNAASGHIQVGSPKCVSCERYHHA